MLFREDIPNMAVFVTDNPAYATSAMAVREARRMKDMGIHILVVAVGYNTVQNKSLEKLVTPENMDNQVLVETATQLKSVVKQVSTTICNGKLSMAMSNHKRKRIFTVAYWVGGIGI